MDNDDLRATYDRLKRRFASADAGDLESGGWIGSIVQRAIDADARKVDRAALEARYGARDSDVLAEAIIRRGARRASVAAGTSAAAVTAAEVSVLVTALFDLPIVAPAVAASIAADIAFSTMQQLHSTFELSIVRGAPLSPEAADDCYIVLMSALGIELGEADAAEAGKRAANHHVERVLTKQGRKILGAIAKKTAQKQIAKRASQQTVLRVIAPGIAIPISAALGFFATRSTLRFADRQMRRRAAIVRPLVALFGRAPATPHETVLAALEALMAAPLRGDWAQGQKDALRHTRSVLGAGREGEGSTDADFAARVARVADEVAALDPGAADALFDYLVGAAALDDAASRDDDYAMVLGPIAARAGRTVERGAIAELRAQLA